MVYVVRFMFISVWLIYYCTLHMFVQCMYVHEHKAVCVYTCVQLVIFLYVLCILNYRGGKDLKELWTMVL